MEKTRIMEIEQILRKLPIAYYLGHKLNKISLVDDKTSWFNPMTLEIGISLQQLENTKDFGNINLENDIRCMLYHEVSHAMLTPKILKITDKINIFEDERIETICKTYYERTNFKQFIKRVNHYDGSKPKTAMEYFYQIVRYRKGPQYFIEKVKDIIKKYAFLTYNYKAKYTFSNETENYKNEINYLYYEIEKDFNTTQIVEEQEDIEDEDETIENEEQETTENEDNENNEKIDEVLDDIEDDEDDEDFEDDLDESNINEDNENNEDNEDEEIYTNEELLNIFTNIIEEYHNQNFGQLIQRLLHQHQSIAKANGSAINSYSGKIDVRSCGRDDYKFFVRENRQGNVKQFSKKKLNLFIDRSGSFCDSEHKVNELLHELSFLEKQDTTFSYDLITVGIGSTICKRNERLLKCSGGNFIKTEIFEQYKQVQDLQAENINIILFDGDAFSDKYCFERNEKEYDDYKKHFSVFNHSNCVIISDYSNEDAIRSYCRNAKHIFTHYYTKELEANIVKAITQLLR